MAEILMVSKPVEPPWNDSSKNLVRDLATALVGHHPHVLASGRQALGRATVESVYGSGGSGFSPGLSANARVLWRLLGGPKLDLWHFFFAPNPKSSSAAGLAVKLRNVPSVQTVCSAPRAGVDLGRVLFADRVVVLSRRTEADLRSRGVASARLRRIPPAVAPPEAVGAAAVEALRSRLGAEVGEPLVVYPGDLEFSGAAERVLRAHARLPRELAARLVMACRAKTPRAREREATLRELAGALGIAHRVCWVGEVPDIEVLLAAASLVTLPAEDLYAKMDLPMVLLEAMSRGRPVLVARGSAAEELAQADAAVAVAPAVEAVAEATAELLGDAGRRQHLGARAVDRIRRRHTPGSMAAAYEALYDELIEGRT